MANFNNIIFIKYQLSNNTNMQQQTHPYSYLSTFRDRLNPEFAGIATRYSQQKQRRKTEQSNKQLMQSRYLHSQKVSRKLSKSIMSKSMELSTLEASRNRKMEEVRQREQQRKQEQHMLLKLRQRNLSRSQAIKRRVEKSREELLTRNQEGWRQLKSNLAQQNKFIQQTLQQKLSEKAKQCLQIKKGETAAMKKVNDFFKRKNAETVEGYLKRIRHENRLKRQNEAKLKELKHKVEKLNKTVELKLHYLSRLQAEIGKYKTDIKSHNTSRLHSQVEDREQMREGKNIFDTLYKQSPFKRIDR